MRAAAAILADRLRVVLAIGEANAAQHRAQAAVGGAQIDLMRVEAQGLDPTEAEAADEAARARVAAAEATLADLDAQLAALDHELAASGAVARG